MEYVFSSICKYYTHVDTLSLPVENLHSLRRQAFENEAYLNCCCPCLLNSGLLCMLAMACLSWLPGLYTAAISSIGICSSRRLISPWSTDLQIPMSFFPHFSLDNMCTAAESNILKSLSGASYTLWFRQDSLIFSFFPHRCEHLHSRYHHGTARTQLQDGVPGPTRWSNPASNYCLCRTQALSWSTQAALRLGLRVTRRRC